MTAGFDPPPGFALVGRAEWASFGTEGEARGAPAPVTDAEWREVYVPLGTIVTGLLNGASPPFIIGLSGSVAAGKSTVAAGLAAFLSARPVAVVSTDGFLLPNAVLAPRGRVGFKGFPDTYDNELMARVLEELIAGKLEVRVPLYSHATYDIAAEPQVLSRPDVVILEGVNAFAAGELTRLRIYIDAAEPDLRAWYVARFLGLIEDARTNADSFFAQWTGLGADDAHALAVTVWEAVNLPNLEQHILGTRWDADIVLHKDADHAVSAVAVRSSILPPGGAPPR